MMTRLSIVLIALLAVLGLVLTTAFAPTAGAQDALPRPAQPFGGKIDRTFKDSTPDWTPVQPALPPKGAPNIVAIVLDDVGYGQLHKVVLDVK